MFEAVLRVLCALLTHTAKAAVRRIAQLHTLYHLFIRFVEPRPSASASASASASTSSAAKPAVLWSEEIRTSALTALTALFQAVPVPALQCPRPLSS